MRPVPPSGPGSARSAGGCGGEARGRAGRGTRLTRFVFGSAGRRKVFVVGGCLRGRATERGGVRARPPGLSRRRASGAALGGRRARGAEERAPPHAQPPAEGLSGAEGTPPLPARRSPRRGLLAETSWSSPPPPRSPPSSAGPRAPARRQQTPPPAAPPRRDAWPLLAAGAIAGTAWEQPVSAPRRPSPEDPSHALVVVVCPPHPRPEGRRV